MNNASSLVEMIFTKCGLVYGRDFLSRWEGLNLSEVKADWERELGPVLNHPRTILYGLEHLPDKPPNVIQFRALCNGRPDEGTPRLPAPEMSEEGRAKVSAMLAGLKHKMAMGKVAP